MYNECTYLASYTTGVVWLPCKAMLFAFFVRSVGSGQGRAGFGYDVMHIWVF